MSTTLSTAKRYERQKLVLSITESILSFVALAAFVVTPLSREIETILHNVFTNDYWVFLSFVVIIGAAMNVLTLPFSYYSGYVLEHRYSMSNQTRSGWFSEILKGYALAAVLGLPLLALFFLLVRTYHEMWWLPAGIALFIFTILLSRLAPTIIFPLFYKFVPIDNEEIKQRITKICERSGMKVAGIFRFDMSKNTKKANAAFTGIGKSKRIIIGDTLLDKFSPEEIDMVFAHEVGHYAKKHIWRLMAFNTVTTFAGLFFASAMYSYSLGWFGYSTISEGMAAIAPLPMLALWLTIFTLITTPINNTISRKYEYEADRYALETMHNKEAFAGMMHKLAETNLADVSPHPLVEFWFHDHPSIEKRIKAAEQV